MAIYLDSALPDEARQAMGLGYVRGITTSPALLAHVNPPAVNVFRKLCSVCDGTVFYQLMAATVSERLGQGERILSLNEELKRSDDIAFTEWEAALANGEGGEMPRLDGWGSRSPQRRRTWRLCPTFRVLASRLQ